MKEKRDILTPTRSEYGKRGCYSLLIDYNDGNKNNHGADYINSLFEDGHVNGYKHSDIKTLTADIDGLTADDKDKIYELSDKQR